MSDDMIQLAKGAVPENEDLLRGLTVGLDRVSDFYNQHYFDSYLKEGGSKIKFLSGKKGAGKSHLLRLLTLDATDRGYEVINLDARQVNLFDFASIYLSIIARIDVDELASAVAQAVASSLGYQWKAEEGKTFLDHLADQGKNDSLIPQEIRTALRRTLVGNPYIDSNMATVFSLLSGSRLGYFDLSPEDMAIAKAWLYADNKAIKAKDIRQLGLAPYKIDKYNARNMVRSLAELVHIAKGSGLVITFDNLETIVTGKKEMGVNYTKKRRDDTYESIRALVDDIDNFRYTMFIFAFDRILLDDTKNGLKTYQALWLRIQNEIVSQRLNLFQDLLDLDSANEELLNADAVVEMSRRLAKLLESSTLTGRVLSLEEARALLENAHSGAISIPLLVNRSTLVAKNKEEGDGEL